MNSYASTVAVDVLYGTYSNPNNNPNDYDAVSKQKKSSLNTELIMEGLKANQYIFYSNKKI